MEFNRREAMGNHIASRFICPVYCDSLTTEFLDNFHPQQAEDTLRREASTIGKIVLEHDSQSTLPLSHSRYS